jgi:enoyl-CoA hydratase/carnithine racemase
MLGEAVDAQEAWRIGLANRVVRHEELLDEAYAFARKLKEGPLYAMGVTKQLINREMQMELEAALEMEARAQAICMENGDFREGYRSIVEKRPPLFNRG